MSFKSTKQIRASLEAAVDLFVHIIEKSQKDGMISVQSLGVAAQAIKKFPPFHSLVQEQCQLIKKVVSDDVLARRRSNVFGRLMLKSVAPLWNSSDFERSIIPNILSFFRLVLGDDEDLYARQCEEIVHDLRTTRGEDFEWDAYYTDPRSKVILYRVLVRVAQSFKRFDARQDWFIRLMQYEPSSISLASNTFIMRGGHSPDDVRPFTEHHFYMLMQALFDPVRKMTPEDEKLFARELALSRNKAFGQILSNLARATAMAS